jgi:tetratricopeptide (TPR) repeat protein
MSQGEAPEDLESAWKAILARQGQLGEDPTLADLGLRLIREMGNRPAHRDLLRTLAAAWTSDWRLTLAAAALLVEQAGRRGMDQPPLTEDQPATWAAEALRQCLSELSSADQRNPDIAGNLHAMLGNALRLCGPGHDAEAQEAFTRAIELDPERGEWWYDAGLLDKWRGRFHEGYDANEQARMRLGPKRPVLWNLAICATALGKGEEAVEVWEELGVPARLDRSRGMPYVAGLPPLLLRVLSRTPATDATSDLPDAAVGFELAWVAPLSPCHGVLQSPTFRDAPIDYGDLVLWDGAPVAAHRTAAEDPVPVFPLLEILKPGDERRWAFVALEHEPGALLGLEEALPEGTRVFIRQERVEHHCAACEAGEPHEHGAGAGAGAETASETVPAPVSETGAVPASVPVPVSAPVSETGAETVSETGAETGAVPGAEGRFLRGKVIVPVLQDLSELRSAWESAIGGRAVSVSLPGLYEALGDSKQAGQAHQAWRGIEGKALRQKARS